MSISALRPTVATQFGQSNKKSFGENVVDTVENSWFAKQVYKQEKYFYKTPWYLGWKAYGSKENLKTGWDKAMAWFKPKDVAGKALAIVTLAAGIATDFMGHMLIVGIPYTLSKVFFPFMNISGFATAFHDGVHQAYEKQYVAKHPEKTAKATHSNRSSSKDAGDWVDDSMDSHSSHHIDDHHDSGDFDGGFDD